MERTSASWAMEWSIDLERGLRSKKPGKAVEAILQFGKRLECWNGEPPPKMEEYKMFGLVVGEDKLFANAILLRLADAFRLGDKIIKLSVVKIFLFEMRQRKKRRWRSMTMLTKSKLENHLELVRRIKVAFDNGDAEDRALALLLIGSWADFAQECVEIRYRIYSSVVSSDVFEVKASLFAAGCFCEFSDDFGFVLLEILSNVVTSSETSMDIRLAGAQAFSKMSCSFSLAKRAYEMGLKVLLSLLNEDLSVVMLISLSKIASKSTLLTPTQIQLLFSFFAMDKTLRLQATSLRCLNFVLARGVSFLAGNDLIQSLFVILNEPKYPPALRYETLTILRKLLLHKVTSISHMDEIEFPKLLPAFENVMQSPIMLLRLLAIRVLVDISIKLVSRSKLEPDNAGFAMASQVILLLVDHVTSLVKHTVDPNLSDLQVEKEVKSELILLNEIVKECPNIGGMVASRVCLFVKDLLDILDQAVGKGSVHLHKIIKFGIGNRAVLTTDLVLYVSRILVTCLENVKETNAVTTQICNSLKLLLEYTCQCSLFDPYTCTTHFCLLHSSISRFCSLNNVEENKDHDSNCYVAIHDSLNQYAISALGCAKTVLVSNDNWSAYRAGRFAACQGIWFIAGFMFDQLITKVQSDSCTSWLRFLAQFSYCEMKLQLFFSSERDASLVKWLEANEFSATLFGGLFRKTSEGRFIENLVSACDILCPCQQTVALCPSGHSFGFQRWFFSLRARVLQNTVETLKLSVFGCEQEGNNMVDRTSLQRTISLVDLLSKISCQLTGLAQELDLMSTSFINVSCKSVMIISSLALFCSLLGFVSGFMLFPNEVEVQIFSLDCLGNKLYSFLVEDLMIRLWHVDYETCIKLWTLLKAYGQTKCNFYQVSKNFSPSICYGAKSINVLCSYAVSRMVILQNKAKKVHDEKSMCEVTNDRLQLLLDVIKQWMHIPFQMPTEFFQFRPNVTSELFAMSGEGERQNGIIVSSGFHLSLSLCLHVRNVPPDLPLRLTKLYCILHCSTSDLIAGPCRERSGHTLLGWEGWGSRDMIDLNEKLFRRVNDDSIKTKSVKSGNFLEDGRVLDAYICFEPNEKGQGFSTYLLDVSAFPVGSYRFKWHSCCIDNNGKYWSLLPMNAGPVFCIERSS